VADRSPDGRWVAYASDLSGSYEVYVQAFPGGDPIRVSINGGDEPLFSRDGDELFYLSGEQVFAVPMSQIELGTSIRPELLFTANYVNQRRSWDVQPNDTFIRMTAGPSFLREIKIIQNWVTELGDRTGEN